MRKVSLLTFIFFCLWSTTANASIAYKDSSGSRIYNEWLGMKTGIFVGPLLSGVRSHVSNIVGDFSWKFTAGASFQLDLSRIWAMEFDIQITNKGHSLRDSAVSIFGNFEALRLTRTNCTYLSLPVLFKINARKKSSFYFMFGGYLAPQLGSGREIELIYESKTETEIEKGFNKFPLDMGITISIGTEIGFKNYQFGFELRSDIGFMNTSAMPGYAYQHNQCVSLITSFKYKKPKEIKVFKGVGDL